ncbi:hypothetical protein K438DRAFT_1926005 [Mycena galopus ATCC 62051]|nr:hypothetical protein K438DRAFT_1926005 [Mycena galopus ATCC 62051]
MHNSQRSLLPKIVMLIRRQLAFPRRTFGEMVLCRLRCLAPVAVKPKICRAVAGLIDGSLVTSDKRCREPFAHVPVADIQSPRRQKEEGDISAVFASLRLSDAANAFPPRFAELKRTIWNDGQAQSWKEVLEALEVETARVAERGEKLIPQIPMESIRNGLSPEEIAGIRTAGCVVIKGAVSREEALSWKHDIKSYVAANPGQVKGGSTTSASQVAQLTSYAGFPADNIQVFELYNTRSQIRTCTHASILETQCALLSLWEDRSGEVRLDTPISYFDRLRIRFPGDAKFALGPHVDAGSIERWEDPTYRSCFDSILSGGGAWKSHNPYDAAPRVHARQDLYSAPSMPYLCAGANAPPKGATLRLTAAPLSNESWYTDKCMIQIKIHRRVGMQDDDKNQEAEGRMYAVNVPLQEQPHCG